VKILVVDDDKTLRKLLQASLSQSGDEIIAVGEGEKAWDILSKGEISFVITDWNMPNLSGIDLIQRVRNYGFDQYVYMIMVTARSNREDILSGLEAGADDYLTKPISIQELRARISIGKRILNYQQRLRETQERLYDLATHDSLTGLLNRRALYDQISSEIERASQEERPLSVVLFDIDHFKGINDTYGHLIGDKVLQKVGSVIKKSIRPYDWVGRWGGEEFLVIMNQTPGETAQKAADRVRKAVDRITFERIKGAEDLNVQISGGVGSLEADFQDWDLDDLLHRADVALYEAKHKGRNQVYLFDPEQHEEEA
jgi:two-component system chemotaxis response regulator CheY